MNGGKPTTVSNSITPKTGEILKEYQWAANRNYKSSNRTKTAIRYKRGCEMLDCDPQSSAEGSGMKENFHTPFRDEGG